MKKIHNEPLKNHTTFKIGGPSKTLVIPENEEELIEVIKRLNREEIEYKILGNGSNLLIDDKGINKVVIKNTKACTRIINKSNIVKVGSSISLQRFVRFCVDNDLEGMEYLYSIPGTIGGAIYMNAGRGRKHNKAISDNLISVKIFDGREIKHLKKNECNFNFRKSIFHEHQNWIILEAEFQLGSQTKETGIKKIKERMKNIEKTQNRKYPNAGSIFKNISPIVKLLTKKGLNGLQVGDAKMEGNWICNLGEASFKDVITLIKISKMLSYLTLTKPELEIEIWNNLG